MSTKTILILTLLFSINLSTFEEEMQNICERLDSQKEEELSELVKRLKKTSKLGEGGFGVVVKMADGSAMKYLSLDSTNMDGVVNEIKALKIVKDHPTHFTRMISCQYGSYKYGDNKQKEWYKIFINMDIMKSKTLQRKLEEVKFTNDVLKNMKDTAWEPEKKFLDKLDRANLTTDNFNRSLVWRYMMGLKIAKRLKEFHELGYGHFDIKPLNILFLNDFTPVLSDFGLALHQDLFKSYEKKGIVQGTGGFIAPEVESGSNYSKKADVYSLGITFALLFKGVFNLDSENPDSVLKIYKNTDGLYRILQDIILNMTGSLPKMGKMEDLIMEEIIKKYGANQDPDALDEQQMNDLANDIAINHTEKMKAFFVKLKNAINLRLDMGQVYEQLLSKAPLVKRLLDNKPKGSTKYENLIYSSFETYFEKEKKSFDIDDPLILENKDQLLAEMNELKSLINEACQTDQIEREVEVVQNNDENDENVLNPIQNKIIKKKRKTNVLEREIKEKVKLQRKPAVPKFGNGKKKILI